MLTHTPRFDVKLATTAEELRAAQRLRYEVFVAELGGGGDLVDHDARLERDAFDPLYEHLLLRDLARPADDLCGVVGVYRLLRDAALPAGRAFYSEGEYDLAPLRATGRRLLELGRSCVHADYRGGLAMMALWGGLAEYVEAYGIEVLFGVASFHGTDLDALAAPLSLLHHRHMAPRDLRVRAQPDHFQTMNLIPEAQLDIVAANRAIPPLIKAYLRLGGGVGEGAFVDHAFNTTDVCLVMDTTRMSEKRKAFHIARVS
ncbi:phospholipid/glycerol acyltransferase [Dinoroseobacter shibae DFL 12 = DSM 16493]|jgi:putative hemolysin|uniref:L-ornithine N(alpha)-acyltransferase n=1 Tax=Dinoroseobacter shibae (strain DSM 16493 / NCIMB 14021 / DFL 12) TaxID=398580 RepID=A8LK15_DINSH|nr:GNAT family N-acyltransferase [Dinoroseobacter shibae]ABV93214.1 phospholipid/glycerol acyltransferase [Dinoroseobacter shibae DFL 12 = DSM 16493]URF48134.1 GNAT family N-acetyltransferase [Dinoroseobacter shibae]URF52444.1 GNAT family N-acetyltransferase [Dinoroseobacter shibae]